MPDGYTGATRPQYKFGGGFLDAILGNANPSLAQAQARADELNQVNRDLGLDVNLSATEDQGRLMADRHALYNEILGQGGPEAIGRKVLQKQAMKDAAMESAGFNPIGVLGQSWASLKDMFAGVPDVDLSDQVGAQTAATQGQGVLAQMSPEQRAAFNARMAELDQQVGSVPQFNTGGSVMAPSGTQSFMMEHDKGFRESAGPLAKTVYKNKGGEVWERAYHNPLSGGNKGEK